MGQLVHKDGSVATPESIKELLRDHKLTVNDVKGRAADRGTNVHTALELYAERGILPDPGLYPANEAGYVRGLVEFIKDSNLQVKHSEVMVASAIGGYAGRFDVIGSIDGEVVTKTYPKRSPIKTKLRWDEGLLDLKTSKGVYPSYHLQLDAYDLAYEESGYGLVDHTAVVRVTDDGRYELVEGRATRGNFFAVLAVHNIIRAIEGKA